MTGTALADIEPALDAAARGPRAPAAAGPAAGASALVRVRVALVGIDAAVLGVLPHVLHHVGPLAGAARLAVPAVGCCSGCSDSRRWPRRCAACASAPARGAPLAGLAAMAAVFALSSFVVGAAITGSGDDDRLKELPTITVPHPSGHDDEH